MKNTKTQNEIQAIFSAIEASINTRIASASNDNMLKELNTSKRLFTLHLATVLHTESADYKMLASVIANTDSNSENFFAQKALIKFFQLIKTLSQNIDNLDRYTRNYLTSMLLLKASATNEQIQKGMSKAIILNESDLVLRKNQLHIATTTSSTQASSTRKMLAYANVTSYDKTTKLQTFKNEAMQNRIAKILKFS